MAMRSPPGGKVTPKKFISDRIAMYSSNVFKTSLAGSPVVVFCGVNGNRFLCSNKNELVREVKGKQLYYNRVKCKSCALAGEVCLLALWWFGLSGVSYWWGTVAPGEYPKHNYCIQLFAGLLEKKKMVATTSNTGGEVQEVIKPVYAWKSDLRAFDDSKAGVKGIADAGLAKIPEIFVSNPNKHQEKPGSSRLINLPVIDFGGIDEDATLRKEIIEKVRDASERLGFFQVVNHGIPLGVMEEVIDGIRRFHEQDTEVKKQFYSRDNTKSCVYNSNFDLYQVPTVNWRDSLYCVMAPNHPHPEELPQVCR
ncbi:hypothetical protein RHSIM_Rhsim10G0067900 [Rhododendron simsii]|uniref:Non-haem dioxygenase N-terminal domain-containing protein n=1 Tax=Rhododendron simsii TaxID=118357 RepID=A0A834GBM8_RHOSS|nr:hypothetical protein RHSIM_Rhsim10G0067900 [Rhododendron simsii]